jgi:hypothetical protein
LHTARRIWARTGFDVGIAAGHKATAVEIMPDGRAWIVLDDEVKKPIDVTPGREIVL